MRKRFNPSKLVLILIIPILILSISFHINSFDEDYYHEQFEKNSIYQQFDITEQELHQINHELLDYLRHGHGEINLTNPQTTQKFYNQKETTHLIEVRELIQDSLILFYFFLTIFIFLCLIIYLRNKKQFTKNLLIILTTGNMLNIIFTLILSALMFTNFSKFFTNFHLALFKTDTWLLNPMTDNLIKMFPQQFFYDIGLKIISNSIIISVVLVLISLYTYRIMKNVEK